MKSLTKYTFLFALIALVSCRYGKDEPEEVQMERNFFPIDTTEVLTYQTHTLTYSYSAGLQKIDTSDYVVKEIWYDQYMSFDERQSEKWIYHVFDSNQVKFDSIEIYSETYNGIIKNRNNKRTIELSYPIEVDKTWDINATNTDSSLFVEYNDYFPTLPEQYSLPEATPFGDCIMVTVRNKKSDIDSAIVQNIYCANVGLVYARNTTLEINQKNNIWSGIAEQKYLLKKENLTNTENLDSIINSF